MPETSDKMPTVSSIIGRGIRSSPNPIVTIPMNNTYINQKIDIKISILPATV
jgi:hypothetical protein